MKAVIMAGGEGKRLRPLTCDIPKPMARLCGRPILEYIMDLLVKNEVNEATITMKYKPEVIVEHFPNNAYKQMKLNFVVEDEPLGTAGSVKNAANNFTDPFIVISGDAMCDYDLAKAVKYHNSIGAAVTILCANVEDPREYGLVRTNRENRIDGFIEKPGWGQVTTDLANTGIYIINPEVLTKIPDNQQFDFAKDLFPMLLNENIPIYAYHATGYWCDIGDLNAYLHCQQDMLNGKVECDLYSVAQGIFAKSKLPHGDYSIIPPIYIGDQVEIEEGATIGPNTIIDDGCLVGKAAKIRHSLMLENAYAGKNSTMNGAILCAGASLKRGASMFEGSCAGAGAIIGEGATVIPGVLVWNKKYISDTAVVNDNVKFGMFTKEMFEDSEIKGENGVELTPEVCARIGSAIGSTKYGRKTGIATDGTIASKTLKLALMSGLMSTGSHVWDFGDCFEAQLSFFTAFCGLGIGIFVSNAKDTAIKVCGEGGLSLPRYIERDIEARISKGEFNRPASQSGKDIANMNSIQMMYQQELCRCAPTGLQGISAQIKCSNDSIRMLLQDCLNRLGCSLDDDMVLKINQEGTNLTISAPEAGTVPFEKLLAICCLDEFRNGHDIALPYDAPLIIDSLAKSYGKKQFRYLRSPADESDLEARKLSIKQMWVRDGLFMAVRVMSIMSQREMTLKELVDELPEFYVERKVLQLDISPTKLKDLFHGDEADHSGIREGISIKHEKGNLLITPSRAGTKLKVFAEAVNMEIAQELCAEIECKLKNKSIDNNPH